MEIVEVKKEFQLIFLITFYSAEFFLITLVGFFVFMTISSACHCEFIDMILQRQLICLLQVFRDLSDANPSWLHHVKVLANHVTGNLWRAFHSKELKQKDVRAIPKPEPSDYQGDYERQIVSTCNFAHAPRCSVL